MTSQAEVRRLAVAVLDAYLRLDVPVNNVGGFWPHRHPTADDLERTFALNYLALFLLTNLLMDRLTASAPARVVTVSSGAQAMESLVDNGESVVLHLPPFGYVLVRPGEMLHRPDGTVIGDEEAPA
jgi:NAD(P)-dependent dehydrogenase (short-subunit alcohol dehydrogenase family)